MRRANGSKRQKCGDLTRSGLCTETVEIIDLFVRNTSQLQGHNVLQAFGCADD